MKRILKSRLTSNFLVIKFYATEQFFDVKINRFPCIIEKKLFRAVVLVDIRQNDINQINFSAENRLLVLFTAGISLSTFFNDINAVYVICKKIFIPLLEKITWIVSEESH